MYQKGKRKPPQQQLQTSMISAPVFGGTASSSGNRAATTGGTESMEVDMFVSDVMVGVMDAMGGGSGGAVASTSSEWPRSPRVDEAGSNWLNKPPMERCCPRTHPLFLVFFTCFNTSSCSLLLRLSVFTSYSVCTSSGVELQICKNTPPHHSLKRHLVSNTILIVTLFYDQVHRYPRSAGHEGGIAAQGSNGAARQEGLSGHVGGSAQEQRIPVRTK